MATWVHAIYDYENQQLMGVKQATVPF
jgi:hypothetical protein